MMTNPILIINECPGATVTVDGETVLTSTGVFHLESWNSECRIDVKAPNYESHALIRPFDEWSDSGSIHVSKGYVEYHLLHKLISSK
jgi:hypothetical protein